jgi:hypothetical protein
MQGFSYDLKPMAMVFLL